MGRTPMAGVRREWFVRSIDFFGDLVEAVIDLAKGGVESLLHENADFASVDLAKRVGT